MVALASGVGPQFPFEPVIRVRCSWFAVLLALTGLSCATPSATYVEPSLPPGGAAVLTLAAFAGRTLEISEIDGRLVNLTNHPVSSYWKKRTVDVTPGSHAIDVYLIAGAGASIQSRHRRVSLLAVSGHVYEVSSAGEDVVMRDRSQGSALGTASPALVHHPQMLATMSLKDLQERVVTLAQQGRYADAAECGIEAVHMAEQLFGPDDASIARALYRVAVDVYEAQGRYAEAEPLLAQAITILKRCGTDETNLATVHSALAAAYQGQGREDEAEALYEQIFSALERRRGRNHPDVIAAAANLAAVYHTRGQDPLAQILYQRVLAFQEKAFGRNDPRLWDAVYPLAQLYHAHQQYAKAEALYQRAARLFGPADPHTTMAFVSYARLLRDMGKIQQAEAMEARAARYAGRAPY